MSDFVVVELDANSFTSICAENNLVVPIEQSLVWQEFAKSCDVDFWKFLLVKNADKNIAVVSLYEYFVRGFKYLWAKNGPIYFDGCQSFEKDVCLALRDFVVKADPKVTFIRLHVEGEFDFTRPVMRLITYDKTVVLDISGSDDEILSAMKPRGRRDVRKGLRESGMECHEESKTILDNFGEVYSIMQETASRDGFVPHEADYYKKMVEFLGDNCKFFVGRIDGKAVCWSITTVYDGVAVQYYAATSKLARGKNCYDHLVYSTCCYLRDMGVKDFDLMGIGSDFSPSLMGLNEFKTKFCKEVTSVAPARDVVCNARQYSFMSFAYKLKCGVRKVLGR